MRLTLSPPTAPGLLLIWVAVIVAYCLTGDLILAVQQSSNVVTPLVFLPEGFALAAALQWGIKAWPAIVIGQACLASTNGLAILPSVLLGFSNASLDVAGAWLIQRLGVQFPISRIRHFGVFLAVVLLFIQPLSATFGLSIIGGGGISQWLSWWCGNAAAQATLTLILLSSKNCRQLLARPRNILVFIGVLLIYATAMAVGWQLKVVGAWAVPLLVEPVLVLASVVIGDFCVVTLLGLAVQLTLLVQQALFEAEWLEGVQLGLATLFSLLFTQLIAILMTREKVLQSELRDRSRLLDSQLKLATVASSLTHEINQPLAVLRLLFSDESLVASGCYRTDWKEAKTLVGRMVDQSGQIRSILQLMKSQSTDHCDVRYVFRLQELLAGSSQLESIRFVIDPSQPLIAGCSDSVLSILLDNLLRNAREAPSSDGADGLRVEVTAVADSDAHQLALSVADNGLGFEFLQWSAEPEPFFTTKPEGTGIGLFLVRTIVEKLGGSVIFSRSAMGGALVVVRLPLKE